MAGRGGGGGAAFSNGLQDAAGAGREDGGWDTAGVSRSESVCDRGGCLCLMCACTACARGPLDALH
jgi:hypothetical protein